MLLSTTTTLPHHLLSSAKSALDSCALATLCARTQVFPICSHTERSPARPLLTFLAAWCMHLVLAGAAAAIARLLDRAGAAWQATGGDNACVRVARPGVVMGRTRSAAATSARTAESTCEPRPVRNGDGDADADASAAPTMSRDETLQAWVSAWGESGVESGGEGLRAPRSQKEWEQRAMLMFLSSERKGRGGRVGVEGGRRKEKGGFESSCRGLRIEQVSGLCARGGCDDGCLCGGADG